MTTEEITDRVTFDWYHASGEVHRGGSPIPFHASLTNPTTDDRVVHLAGSWDGFDGRVSRRIEMPAGARKELDFYLGPAGQSYQFTVRLSAGDGSLIEEARLSSVPLSPDQPVVGLLSRHPMGWGDLRRSDAYAGRVVHLEPGKLPGSAAGLGAFDLLIWPRPEPWTLRAEQLQGLVHWVEGGGHLVLADAFADAQALTPWTTIATAEPLVVTDLESLGAAVGVPLARFPEPLAVTPLQPSGGQVWITAPSGPIAVEASRGLGSVTVLGFDPSAPQIAGWPGLGAFWRRLLSRRQPAGPDALQPQPGARHPYLSQDLKTLAQALVTVDRGGTPLPYAALAAVLLLYLVAIGPGEYFALRRLQRLEWTWVTFPVWVGLFSLGAYLVATQTRSESDFVRHILQRDLPPGAESFRDELHAARFATRPAAYRLAPMAAGARPVARPGSTVGQFMASLHHPSYRRRSSRRGWGRRQGWSNSQLWGTPQHGALHTSGLQGQLLASQLTGERLAQTFEQGPAAIHSWLPKWSFLAGSFESYAPAAGATVETRIRWADEVSPHGEIVPHLGVDLVGARLLFADSNFPYGIQLRPGRDGEPIAIGAETPIVPFDPEDLSVFTDWRPATTDEPLEAFVPYLATDTAGRLLLAHHAVRAWSRHVRSGPSEASVLRHDWSALLASGGGVFLGWAEEEQPRLEGDEPTLGLLVFRVGIAAADFRGRAEL
ncbi:MAG: hypothetical protein AAF657_25625 [Acidobacteriota bacterium]